MSNGPRSWKLLSSWRKWSALRPGGTPAPENEKNEQITHTQTMNRSHTQHAQRDTTRTTSTHGLPQTRNMWSAIGVDPNPEPLSPAGTPAPRNEKMKKKSHPQHAKFEPLAPYIYKYIHTYININTTYFMYIRIYSVRFPSTQ